MQPQQAILIAVLPDGTLSSFNDDAAANQHVDDISRIFNGETKTKFQPYWDAIVAVLEEQNGAGARRRCHAVSDVQTTTDVQYAPGIILIPQLRCTATKYLIEEKKMQEGVDFK
eukprot:249670-Ditylum_brightwellii.AAC.1